MKFLKFSELNELSKKKKWILATIGVIIIAIIGTVFFYEQNSTKVFTRSEYIKEVVVQNQSFEDLLYKYLDQVVTYNGTAEATEKLETTAAKFQNFVTALQEKLGPRVPYDCKTHYTNMIAAYNIYLEAIELYKKAVPKNLGDERATLMKEAEDKLTDARAAMKNLEWL